jgi:hypothetical protein
MHQAAPAWRDAKTNGSALRPLGRHAKGPVSRTPPQNVFLGFPAPTMETGATEKTCTSFELDVRPLPLPREQPAIARWGGAQVTRRPARGADRQRVGPRCLEGHHTPGAQRVHLLGRGCQTGDDPRTSHSPDPGGAGGWPAQALLLAGVQAPRPHRQVAVGAPRGGSPVPRGQRDQSGLKVSPLWVRTRSPEPSARIVAMSLFRSPGWMVTASRRPSGDQLGA